MFTLLGSGFFIIIIILSNDPNRKKAPLFYKKQVLGCLKRQKIETHTLL